MDFLPGDCFKNPKDDIITIVDLMQEGYDPNDPNDMGSFEYTNVIYLFNGQRREMDLFLLSDWMQEHKFVTV